MLWFRTSKVPGETDHPYHAGPYFQSADKRWLVFWCEHHKQWELDEWTPQIKEYTANGAQGALTAEGCMKQATAYALA